MMLQRPLFTLLALLFMVAVPSVAGSAPASTQAKLEAVQAERVRLADVRKKLEQQLGALGQELQKLDEALAEASQASREAAAKVRDADERMRDLDRERRQLQAKVEQLRKRLLDEAVAGWENTARTSPWMALLTGVPMSDIPHRSYMLGRIMQSQENDRRAYEGSVKELAVVEAEVARQRDVLNRSLMERQAAEKKVADRVNAKRQLASRVKRDANLQARREAQLAREEKALKRLLEDMRGGLLATDQEMSAQQVRKQKGRLTWPLRGRIVASFGSQEAPGRPKLNGVKIAPAGKKREVHAVAAGQVRYADWFGGYGLMMIVDHGDGVLSVYAHNDVLYKHLGDWVDVGDRLGEAGSTGWVSDVALYFEVRDGGKPVDPARWCRK